MSKAACPKGRWICHVTHRCAGCGQVLLGVPKPSIECIHMHAPNQIANNLHSDGVQCLRPSSKAGQFCMVLENVGMLQLLSDGHQEVTGQRQTPRGGKEQNLWQAMDGEEDSPLLAFGKGHTAGDLLIQPHHCPLPQLIGPQHAVCDCRHWGLFTDFPIMHHLPMKATGLDTRASSST